MNQNFTDEKIGGNKGVLGLNKSSYSIDTTMQFLLMTDLP